MKEVRKFLFSFFLGSGLIGYALRAAGGGRRGRENWRPNRKLAVEQWEAPPGAGRRKKNLYRQPTLLLFGFGSRGGGGTKWRKNII